ncbi:hypothetical protein LUX39_54255 [Actinomadura madurae]|nr:hypothetical protein [Actinomadura madurae]MCQ0021508.1 hypothetical protein [Actinomadura madurae]
MRRSVSAERPSRAVHSGKATWKARSPAETCSAPVTSSSPKASSGGLSRSCPASAAAMSDALSRRPSVSVSSSS